MRKEGPVRKLMLLGGVTALLLGASSTSASADTWNGNCTFAGSGRFAHPYTAIPSYNSYTARARGTCTGTLNRARYSGPASVFLDGRMVEPMSCELGVPRDVPTTLTFGKSTRRAPAKRVLLNAELAPRFFGEQAFHFSGAYNGQGYGRMSFHVGLPEGEACLNGRGVPGVSFDLDTHTVGAVYG
jgi:hypothetical protein